MVWQNNFISPLIISCGYEPAVRYRFLMIAGTFALNFIGMTIVYSFTAMHESLNAFLAF